MPVLFLLILVVVGYNALGWWQRRQYAAEMVAALEAAKMHKVPILIRSQFIGDTDVENRAQDLRERLEAAQNPFITHEDVVVQIYSTRAATGRAFIDFDEWRAMVENAHTAYVAEWQMSRSSSKAAKRFTEEGMNELKGQRTPEFFRRDGATAYEWENVKYSTK